MLVLNSPLPGPIEETNMFTNGSAEAARVRESSGSDGDAALDSVTASAWAAVSSMIPWRLLAEMLLSVASLGRGRVCAGI